MSTEDWKWYPRKQTIWKFLISDTLSRADLSLYEEICAVDVTGNVPVSPPSDSDGHTPMSSQPVTVPYLPSLEELLQTLHKNHK